MWQCRREETCGDPKNTGDFYITLGVSAIFGTLWTTSAKAIPTTAIMTAGANYPTSSARTATPYWWLERFTTPSNTNRSATPTGTPTIGGRRGSREFLPPTKTRSAAHSVPHPARSGLRATRFIAPPTRDCPSQSSTTSRTRSPRSQ